MPQIVRIALAQTAHIETFASGGFEHQLRALVERHPGFDLWVFPEFHLEPDQAHKPNFPLARAVDDAAFARLGALARELGIWLVPGTVYERAASGDVHNTALVYSPDGERVASYRKMFPWRPAELSHPGGTFEVFEVPGIGRIGLSICYDIWFPEHTRHLAWLGADLVLNLVQTGTSDREQELTIVRGNAIMNQVWVASVNAAAPTGRGRSLIADPAGTVVASSPDASEEILTAVIDLGAAARVQTEGTAGVSRPWHQFRDPDATIPLPLYAGEIAPSQWTPSRGEEIR